MTRLTLINEFRKVANEDMTLQGEVNSDNDDDIGSFFTVQNSAATVSVLEQLNNCNNQLEMFSHSACFHS